MRYIRTIDNKVFDLEKIKESLKKNSAYPHLYDWKLEPTNDEDGSLRLSWMADFEGSKSKQEKVISPRECSVILNCNSSEYKQSDTIEELGDAYVIVPKDKKYKPYTVNTLSLFDDFEDVLKHNDIYLSIWIDALLKPVAKMNNNGDLELLC